MFQLTQQEQDALPARLNTGKSENRGGRRNLPYAFTQEGVSMLSGVLNSDRAVQVNILIMRAFVQLRQVSEAHLDLVKRFDQLESRCNEQFRAILDSGQRPVPIYHDQPTSFLISYHGTSVKVLEGLVIQAPIALIPQNKVAKNKLAVGSLTAKKECRSKIEAIRKGIAIYFGLKLSDLNIVKRTRAVVLPRQIAIYLIRKHTGIGFKEIAQYFGRKDHTTAMHAYRKIANAVELDNLINEIIQAVENSL